MADTAFIFIIRFILPYSDPDKDAFYLWADVAVNGYWLSTWLKSYYFRFISNLVAGEYVE